MLGQPFATNVHYQPSGLPSVIPLPQPLSSWGNRYVPPPQERNQTVLASSSSQGTELSVTPTPLPHDSPYPTHAGDNYVFLIYVWIILDQSNKNIEKWVSKSCFHQLFNYSPFPSSSHKHNFYITATILLIYSINKQAPNTAKCCTREKKKTSKLNSYSPRLSRVYPNRQTDIPLDSQWRSHGIHRPSRDDTSQGYGSTVK